VLLHPTGAAIGLIDEAEFGENTIELEDGDLLVLYTDGVTEAVDLQNQEFGRERLTALSRQVNTLPVKEIGIRSILYPSLGPSRQGREAKIPLTGAL
jgi:serine phosphatase RsbU (regulator of sigma subunit)